LKVIDRAFREHSVEPESREFEVLVVGGGLAGPTAAIRLEQLEARYKLREDGNPQSFGIDIKALWEG
jgi:succinate dehydrogenase/fumarate reductase flavoprotein subunit